MARTEARIHEMAINILALVVVPRYFKGLQMARYLSKLMDVRMKVVLASVIHWR